MLMMQVPTEAFLTLSAKLASARNEPHGTSKLKKSLEDLTREATPMENF